MKYRAMTAAFRAQREILKMSQEELAQAAGVSLESIIRIEYSINSAPFHDVLSVGRVLGFDVYPKH